MRKRPLGFGIDADTAGTIIAAIFAKGWSFWLSGGPHTPSWAFILKSEYGVPWCHAFGGTPAGALGCA